MNEALRLAEALIACPSITPTDGGCQALLEQVLGAAGFACESLPAGPEDARVSNLWAVPRGACPGPTLVLAGHTDVVPTGPADRWTSGPFVPSHREGRLYGRGAADMKAGVAAMAVAAAEYVRVRPDHPGTVALLFTSDEEGPALHGTEHVVQLLQQRGERLNACVLGEPTSVDRVGDMVKNGRRGAPVSYTHLDVYKRQIRAAVRAPAPTRPAPGSRAYRAPARLRRRRHGRRR